MELALSLGIGGWGLLILGAIVIGVGGQLIGEVEFGYEWLLTSAAAFVGGLVASEVIVGWRTVDPVWDGLALLPALAGGLVVGAVVEVATRLLTGGHYLPTA
jgi:hypothetical protein